jgi:hypothetical protein
MSPPPRPLSPGRSRHARNCYRVPGLPTLGGAPRTEAGRVTTKGRQKGRQKTAMRVFGAPAKAQLPRTARGTRVEFETRSRFTCCFWVAQVQSSRVPLFRHCSFCDARIVARRSVRPKLDLSLSAICLRANNLRRNWGSLFWLQGFFRDVKCHDSMLLKKGKLLRGFSAKYSWLQMGHFLPLAYLKTRRLTSG